MRKEDRIMCQQEAIRRSGLTNMFDKTMVQRIAHECEFYALVCFIEDASGEEYMKMASRARQFDGDDLGEEFTVPESMTIETQVTLG